MTIDKIRRALTLLTSLLALTAGLKAGLPWPIAPENPTHIVSFFYGGWQGMWREELMRNVNYFHAGIDIPGDTMATAYAVESGYVKAIFTIFDSDYHWRIIIADSSGTQGCNGWLYAHIYPTSIPFTAGDYVETGDSLGVIVTWPYPNTPVHLHLSRIRFSGSPDDWANGFWDYEVIANPLNYLGPIGDETPPFFENAWGDQLFAICSNQTSNYFDAGEDITGDVDIICSAYDYGGYGGYRSCPYKIEYKIDGDSSIPWTTAFEFSGSLDSYDGEMEALSKTVYKYDSYCNSTFTDSLMAFFNMTNTDGDGIIEASDTSYCWSTEYFHNGEYRIAARLSDFDGNTFVDSMVVTVGNYYPLSGKIVLEGINPDTAGTSIEIAPDNHTASTQSDGSFGFASVGGGYQTVSVSRPGYMTFDTLMLFDRSHQLDITLDLVDYGCGDANFDGMANVADAVYLINFVFKGGPVPVPFEAGDANCDGGVNVGDAVYLISYVFKGGPEPCCP